LSNCKKVTDHIVNRTESFMSFPIKKSLAVAAALLLTGGTASAAAVITGWNLDNVSVSTATPNVAGTSTISAGTAASTTGRITFDGDEADSPGVKIINDDSLTGANGSNCIMANSDSSCNGPKQSGKRFKFQSTGSAPTDMVFNVNPNGSFASGDNDGLYKVFQAFGNDTGTFLDSFQVTLGTGVGDNFLVSTINDGLSFVQTFDDKAPNSSQFSALFSNGLFGKKDDDVHLLDGYFDTQRTGFSLAFGPSDSFLSTGLFGSYASLFGSMLSYDQLPQGYFFDDDGDASTDNVLIAHQLADGSWVQNRSVNSAGIIGKIANGNAGTAYSDLNALVAALSAATGFEQCGVAAPGEKCLAGTDAIDDLAKFNLSFFINPTGFEGTQFTIRYAAGLVSEQVPEPGALALVMLGLGALGVTTRRRRKTA
jgi:hypothetical protein